VDFRRRRRLKSSLVSSSLQEFGGSQAVLRMWNAFESHEHLSGLAAKRLAYKHLERIMQVCQIADLTVSHSAYLR